MLLPHGTIVAVVDGKQFSLFRNTGNEATPVLEAQEAPQLDERNHSAGGHHPRTASSPSPKQLIEDSHGAAVVDWLNHEVLEHRIADLVVVAPPKTLGEMRPRYHGQLEKVLRKELAKELPGRSGADILAALNA